MIKDHQRIGLHLWHHLASQPQISAVPRPCAAAYKAVREASCKSAWSCRAFEGPTASFTSTRDEAKEWGHQICIWGRRVAFISQEMSQLCAILWHVIPSDRLGLWQAKPVVVLCIIVKAFRGLWPLAFWDTWVNQSRVYIAIPTQILRYSRNVSCITIFGKGIPFSYAFCGSFSFGTGLVCSSLAKKPCTDHLTWHPNGHGRTKETTWWSNWWVTLQSLHMEEI